jgi:type VI secretion system Hcp family effector
MADNIYLQIEPIKGSSLDSEHEEWIEVTDFKCSISNNGDMRRPKAEFGPLEVKKLIDAATPDLMLRCANGYKIDNLVLDVCRLVNEENVVVLKYEMEGVRVVSFISSTGDEGGYTYETIKFAYNSIKCTAIPVDRGGNAGATFGPKGWDILANKNA